MSLRFGMDPSQQRYRFDFESVAKTKATEMLAGRREFEKRIYPDHLLFWLFAKIYSLELAWKELSGCFRGGKSQTDYASAINVAGAMLAHHREKLVSIGDSILEIGSDSADVSFSQWRQSAQLASRGDNGQVERLEFAYACFGVRQFLFVYWAALGLLGHTPESAYMELVSFVYVDDERRLTHEKLLSNYADASQCFGMSIAASMGGVSGVPGAYHPLPPLW